MKYLSKDGTDIVTLDGVDLASGVARMGGNKNIFFKLLVKFATSPQLNANFEELIAESNEALLKYIHTQKGVLGNLSISPLFEETVELEKQFKEGNTDKGAFESWIKSVNDIKVYLNDAIVVVE